MKPFRSLPLHGRYRELVVLLTLLLSFAPLRASHVSGVDISWECTGNNTYLITLDLFRDCSGISMSATQTIDIVSDCGQSFTVNLTQGPGSGQEISQLCPQDLPQSDCNNGGYPGMEAYNYQGTVVLAPPCDSWTISWSQCCRNPAVNVPNSTLDDMFAEAVLNTATNPCNSSPVFTAAPIPFVCLNQPVSYNYGVYDPDGDSLVYSLISARQDLMTNLVYGAGYSATAPIPGITLDPNTGAVNFTPTMIGNFVVVVQVEEYDAFGNLLGSVMRDMQFTVINCTNILPEAPLGYSNLTGDAVATGPNSLELCLGSGFCLDLVFTDGNANDSLILTSNVGLVLPGATMVQTGVNPATATICWTAVPGTSSLASFTVFAEDNACPVTGLTQSTVFVTFLPTTTIDVSDTTLCHGEVLPMNVSGGTLFNWTTLSGPPIQVGVNFSCTPCANPVASPIATTVYEVTSDLNGFGCVNKDTITVTVVPDFGFLTLDPVDATCNGYTDGTISIEPWGTPGPPWTYDLYQGGVLLQTQTVPGDGYFDQLGAGSYVVQLSEPLGCSHDTVIVINEPDLLVTTTTDTTVCLSTVATISAQAVGGTSPIVLQWDQGLVGSGPHAVSPDVDTDYTVFAIDAQGCTSAPVISALTYHPPLDVVALAPDSICIGALLDLDAIGAGGIGHPYSYTWTGPGNTVIGSDSAVSIVQGAQTSTYIVTVEDACGTPEATDTVTVSWYPAPVPLVVPDIYEDCFPAEITFTNATNPADVGSTCTWDFGDGNTASGCTTVSNIFQNVGCYDITLTVYSPEGCPGTAVFPQLVCARPYPVADFDHYPFEPNVLAPDVAFTDRSTDAVSWAWSFGSASTPDSAFVPNPGVRFPENDEGDYPVWLHVENIYGCPDSILRFIHVNGLFFLYSPNTFTPDGDGVNEVFDLVGQGFSDEGFVLEIFDRWGNIIASADRPGKGWDGTFNGGEPAPQGIYAWRAEVTDRYTNTRKRFMGHVTLLR